jgi:hypothetical protein
MTSFALKASLRASLVIFLAPEHYNVWTALCWYISAFERKLDLSRNRMSDSGFIKRPIPKLNMEEWKTYLDSRLDSALGWKTAGTLLQALRVTIRGTTARDQILIRIPGGSLGKRVKV